MCLCNYYLSSVFCIICINIRFDLQVCTSHYLEILIIFAPDFVVGDNSINIWNTNVRPDGSFYEICGSADILNQTNKGEFTVCLVVLNAAKHLNFFTSGWPHTWIAHLVKFTNGVQYYWGYYRGFRLNND